MAFPTVMSLDPNDITDELIELFNSKIVIDPDTGCWIWQEGLNKDGYGRFIIPGYGRFLAHRACMLLDGYVFTYDRPLALHKCPQLRKDCVCRDHLYAGSSKQNSFDMFADGTSNTGVRNPSCKLKPHEPAEIKRRIMNGESIKSIADDYPIGYQMVHRIKKGLAWNDVLCARNPRLGNFHT